jgi:hypothetical protein
VFVYELVVCLESKKSRQDDVPPRDGQAQAAGEFSMEKQFQLPDRASLSHLIAHTPRTEKN